jgi:hypothetical protein
MTAPKRKREIFANPFFAILLVVSVFFVVTVLAYLVSGGVVDPFRDSDRGPAPVDARQIVVGAWFDRNVPLLLGGEILVMLFAGVLAMLFDPKFSAGSKPKPPK